MHASCCSTAASSAISTTAAALRSHTRRRFHGAHRPQPVSKSSISPTQLSSFGDNRSGRGFSFQHPRAKVGRMEAAKTPMEVPAGMEDQEQLMTQLSSIPSIARAWLLPGADGGTELRVELSQRDQPANKGRSFASSSSLPSSWSPGESVSWSWPAESSDVLSRSFSPSGNKMVVAKASSAPADSLALEIWSRGRLLSTTLVPKTLHGPLINDGYFATGFSWSRNEERVAYTAEAPEEIKSKEFRSTLMAREATKSAGAEQPEAKAPTWRGFGPWEEDWGELNVGKRPPALFVLTLDDMSVRPVLGLPADTSCGQPVWEPSGEGLVFVGWPHKAENFPQSVIRLGVVYCYNRPCHLWRVSVPQDANTEPPPTATCLTEDLMSAQAPRFSPDGKKLVFLSWHSATTTGVHNSTAALFCMNWEPEIGPAKEVVGVVQEPLADTGFPGIYAGFGSLLLENPFLDNDTIILGSQWRSALAILKVDLSSGKVDRLTPEGGDRPNYALLAAKNGLLVAAASGPCAAHLVMVAKVDEANMAVPEWHPLPFEDDPAALLSGIEHHVLQVEPSLSGSSSLPFEAIVIRPSGAEPGPTVLMPHGGPHHAFLATYVMPLAFLARCGYTIVLVNFRGSTGFGEASVQSLPGHAGTQDVSDCMDALAASVAAGYSDQSAVAACGGSHGGFLTGHLVGQHPSAFRAGILRNPVLDLGLMIFCSDIPDWVYIEAWGQAEGMARFKPRPDATDLERFYEVSPIRYVNSVTAPLLFMLGEKDHRVTWNDARHYMATLQSRADAPDVQAWLFPEDSHALDRPQTEVEQWLNTAAWLKKYCSPP